MKRQPPQRSAQVELESTVDTGPEQTASERARELFAHGLLLHEADARAPGAGRAREARVTGVLASIRGEEPRASQGNRLARILVPLAVAALALVAVVFAWPSRESSTVLALVDKTHERLAKGVHVYEARLVFRRHRGRILKRRWQIALAPGGKLQIKWRWFRMRLEIIFDGEASWFRSPLGVHKSLRPPTRAERAAEGDAGPLGAELGYAQLQPFLRSVLVKERLSVQGRRKDRSGRQIVDLGGDFVSPRKAGTPIVDPRSLPSEGKVSLSIEEDTGLLLELRIERDRPGPFGLLSYQLLRKPTPDDLAAAGIRFKAPK